MLSAEGLTLIMIYTMDVTLTFSVGCTKKYHVSYNEFPCASFKHEWYLTCLIRKTLLWRNGCQADEQRDRQMTDIQWSPYVLKCFEGWHKKLHHSLGVLDKLLKKKRKKPVENVEKNKVEKRLGLEGWV